MLRARHREGLDMCSSQVMRWAQNALRCRERHGAEMEIADGTGKGRRAGDVRAKGWPLWPSGSRCDAMRCGAVRSWREWIRRRSYLVVPAALSPESGSGTVPRPGAC